LAFPRPVSRDRQGHPISETDFKGTCGHQTARGFRSDYRCEPVFGCKGSDHFAGASGMFVNENCGLSLKLVATESLCDQCNRAVAKSKPEKERDQFPFVIGNTIKFWKAFGAVSALGSSARKAITYESFLGA